MINIVILLGLLTVNTELQTIEQCINHTTYEYMEYMDSVEWCNQSLIEMKDNYHVDGY